MDDYLIINVRNLQTHNHHRGWYLPGNDRPSLIHWNKTDAENEIVRLQRKYPEEQFVIFKSVAYMHEVENGAFVMTEEQK